MYIYHIIYTLNTIIMKRILLLLALLPILLFGQFNHYSTADGLIGDNVKCVLSDQNNTYIATNAGLSVYNGTIFNNYNTSEGLLSNSIRCMVFDTTGRLWLGVYGGVSVFDGVSFTNFTTSEGLIGGNVKDVELDAQGRVWIATSNGISVYNGYTFINYTTLDGLPTNSIKSLSLDDNGIMWVGTAVGLCKFNNPGFTVYTTNEGLTSNYVSVFEASDKVYIALTSGGLSVFDGTSSTVYNNTNGLPSSPIIEIDIDQNNNIWLVYDQEIIEFDLVNVTSYSNLNSNLMPVFTNVNICETDTFISSANGYFSLGVNGFTPIYKYDTLNINNINALVNSNGILFQYLNSRSLFETPAGSGMHSNLASTIWLGGTDEDNTFYMAGGRFHGSTDWEAGPISNNYNTIEYDTTYKRVWKINKSDIDYHIAHWNDGGYTTPNSIKQWPGIADYVDFNSNSIYDPENGDYPKIMGDQAILNIFNDDVNMETEGRNKMQVEIHSLVYGYNNPSDSALYNTVFTQYKIYNKSNNNYSNVFLGVYDDIDIGDAENDYMGSDTVTNSFYIYNGDNSDTQFGATTPSAQSVTFLSSKMTSTTYFTNGVGITGDPYYTFEYYNILRGFWKDGTAYTEGGNGYGGTTPVKYVFSGNPQTVGSWNEASSGNLPDDRRGVGIVGPFTINQGQELCIDVAYINAIAYEGTNILSVKELLARAAHIQWWKSTNPGLSCDSIITTAYEGDLSVYALDASVCENEYSVDLNSLVFGGTYPYTYNWEDASGTVISTDQTPWVFTPTNTTTVYYVTVTDSEGVTASDELTITVNQSPIMSLPVQQLHCAGFEVAITMPGYYEYNWNNGSTNETAVYSTGPLAVLTVTNQEGCSTTSEVDMLFAHPVTELYDVTPACEGANLTINPGSFTSYLWSTGATTPTLTLTDPVLPQTIYITATTDDGCEFTDSTIVTVNQPQGVSLGNDTSIAGTDVLVLYPGNYQQYLWFGTNFDPTYTFNGNIGIGTYPIWIDVMDYNGCHSIDTMVVTVLTVNISETETAEIRIYPNPASSYISIDKGNVEIEQISIVSILGKNIKSNVHIDNNNSVLKINISDLKIGTYFLKMMINNEENTVKFIKK